ncbi:MAG: hypothetical protein WCL04_05335 [Verrucomicrobiota bacterium]
MGAALGLLLLAGCTTPVPSYRQVDQDAPDFKAAVGTEAVRLLAAGQSARRAERTAVEQVTAQFIAAEAKRRTELVAPLVRALGAREQPQGCWAYTLTSIITTDGKPTEEIATFDPSRSEDGQWTLVSRDGRPPDEKTQAKFREKKQSEAKKRKETPNPLADIFPNDRQRMEKAALLDQMDVTTATGTTTFAFKQGKISVPLLASMDSARIAYEVENDTGILRRQTLGLTGLSVLAGSLKIDHLEFAIHYADMVPEQPPFAADIKASFRGRLLFKSTGEVAVKMTFSDYHQVECHEDRPAVKMGPLEVIELLPPTP